MTQAHEHDIAGCMDCDCCAAPHVTDVVPCTCPKPERRWCHALTPFPVNGDFGECPLRYGHDGPHKVTFSWRSPIDPTKGGDHA